VIDLRVIPDDGEPYQVTARGRQILVWEQISRNNTLLRLNEAPTMPDLYFLAHLVAVKDGKFTGTLEEFKSSVDIEPIPANEDDEVPTRPGR
jgi:hypothetical protein